MGSNKGAGAHALGNRWDRIKSTVTAVNAYAGVGILVAAIGAQCHLSNIIHASSWMSFGQMGLIWWINSLAESRNSSTFRFYLFLALCFCAGVNTGSWVHVALQESGYCRGSGLSFIPDFDFLAGALGSRGYLDVCKPNVMAPLVRDAFFMTLGTYASISITTYISPSRDVARLGSLITALSWIMFGSALLAMFGLISHQLHEFVYVKIGLAFYALKIMWDAEVVAEDAQSGNDVDVLHHAVSSVLNFLNLFIRIIKIWGNMERDKKRNEEKRRY